MEDEFDKNEPSDDSNSFDEFVKVSYFFFNSKMFRFIIILSLILFFNVVIFECFGVYLATKKWNLFRSLRMINFNY